MKTATVIIVGSVISFTLLIAGALFLVRMKPELFGAAAAPPPAKTAASKIPGAPGTRPDSLGQPGQASPDSLLVAQMKVRVRLLQAEVDSLTKGPQTAMKAAAPAKDWKTSAKLIESMTPEEAGKILGKMKDDEVREVLDKVKKKQAGKILALLDPSRAARILR